MKRIKTLLIFFLVIGLSFSLLGCKLLPWGDSAAEETDTIAGLPQWLTLAHRAEAAEEPEVDEEVATVEEELAVAQAQTGSSQPATTQPATTQPAQQTQQPAQSSGTPRWKQPGTMDYLGKLELDRLVLEYKGLLNRVKKGDTGSDADRLAALKLQIPKLAAGLAIHADTFKQLYGIAAPYTATGDTSSNDWSHDFDNTEAPTGWGSDSWDD